MRKGKRNSQRGFSLLEMLVVIAIFTIIMGAVVSQIVTAQKRYHAEEKKMDITQQSREFVDQIARDLHQAGYPNSKMYGTGVLVPAATPENDSRNAVGLVKFAYDEIGFEADVDGDDSVDTVNYRLVPDGTAGACPCRIERFQAPKTNGAAPYPQPLGAPNVVRTGLQNIANSGGANGAATGVGGYSISGYTPSGASNDAVYAMYKSANVFTAYNATGQEVLPTDYVTDKAALKSIRTIKINVNLLTRQEDMQSGSKPAVTIAASVRVPAN